MALSTLDLQTVQAGCSAARQVIENMKPVVDRLNIIYDSAGGSKSTITQADLDLAPAFSKLSKVQLDDGMFALTSTLRTAITNAYAQLAQLAARG